MSAVLESALTVEQRAQADAADRAQQKRALVHYQRQAAIAQGLEGSEEIEYFSAYLEQPVRITYEVEWRRAYDRDMEITDLQILTLQVGGGSWNCWGLVYLNEQTCTAVERELERTLYARADAARARRECR